MPISSGQAGDLLSPSKSWQQSPALGQAVLAQPVSHSTSSAQRPKEQQRDGCFWVFFFFLIISGGGSGNGRVCTPGRIQL